MKRRLRILVSAYGLDPNRGSEPGVGWNWVRTLAELGHEVTALIYPGDWKGYAEEAAELEKHYGIRFLPHDPGPFLNRAFYYSDWRKQVHFVLWQLGALLKVRAFSRKYKVDYIHHVTIGAYRMPCIFGYTGTPLVFGPVGGGEYSPPSLLDGLPRPYRRVEKVRRFLNHLSGWNPLLLLCLLRTRLVFCKTADTMRMIPPFFRAKCHLQMEIGIRDDRSEDLPDATAAEEEAGPLRLLYVGRLIYWKGVHISLAIFARLRAEGIPVEFTVIGSGKDEAWLRERARALGVEDAVEWVSWIAQKDLFERYRRYDLLVFPSFHDSSGNVVLEALSFGLPVVCLDSGGPKEIVTTETGLILDTQGRSEEEIIEGGAREIAALASEPGRARLQAMRRAAVRVNETWTWAATVKRALALIEETPGILPPGK